MPADILPFDSSKYILKTWAERRELCRIMAKISRENSESEPFHSYLENEYNFRQVRNDIKWCPVCNLGEIIPNGNLFPFLCEAWMGKD